jgi:hypothetical protein
MIIYKYCVWACIAKCLDATMPQFYVAIGFAMQLTLVRLRAKKGIRGVVRKQLQRSFKLYMVAFVTYSIENQKSWANLCENWHKLLLQPILSRNVFMTLAVISVTQLIILPVITRPVWIRMCYMVASMAIYMLGQWAFWLKYQWHNAVDGGSFGAFSWAFVMIAGTFLNDWNEVST